MKDDEKAFLKLVAQLKEPDYKAMALYARLDGKCPQLEDMFLPRDIINGPGFTMHHKRAWKILEKWADKGWYEYGVSLDMGWLTAKGKEEAAKL